MRDSRRFRVLRLLILTVPLLWACDTTEPVLVGSVTIVPVDTHVTVGSSVQLAARVLSNTGSVLSGHPVTWTSSHQSVATVSPSGLLVAVAPGTATIRATAEGKSGSVTFTVASGPCTASMTAGSITLGQEVTGTLGPTDCMLDGYMRAEGWTFQLTSAREVRFLASSGSFPAGLVLTDLQLNIRLWGTWHPDGAQAFGELPAGQYIVWVASWAENPSGSYRLSAAEAQLCGPARTTAIAVGDAVAGTLAASDCLFIHGGVADGFRVVLPAGTGLRVDLASTDFDALLVVTDADMNLVAWDDDSGGDGNARIHRRFPAGEYLIWATGYEPSASGGYEFSVTEAEVELCPTVGELQPGQTVTGTLATTDCLAGGFWYTDPWQLSVSAQTTLRIDLTSTHFDTLLIIEDEYGEFLAADDDGGEGYNSRLVYTFPAGNYRVVATSFDPGATGAYQLSAVAVGASAADARPGSPSGSARPWLKAGKR